MYDFNVYNYQQAKELDLRRFIAIHRSPQHTDDIQAGAVALSVDDEPMDIVVISRNDEELDFAFKRAKYVLDVGKISGIFETEFGEKQYRFDHHQYNDDNHPRYENGIKKAAVGFLLEHFVVFENKFDKEIYNYLLENLVYGIDAQDNGQDTDYKNKLMFISDFNRGEQESEEEYLQNLKYNIDFARRLFDRNIKLAKVQKDDEKYVNSEIMNAAQNRSGFIVLDHYCKCAPELVREFNDNNEDKIIFIIQYSSYEKEWVLNTVRVSKLSFTSYKKLPAEWAGKDAKELAEVTGLKSAIFCHNGRFVAKFKDREDVLKAVKMVLDYVD